MYNNNVYTYIYFSGLSLDIFWDCVIGKSWSKWFECYMSSLFDALLIHICMLILAPKLFYITLH